MLQLWNKGMDELYFMYGSLKMILRENAQWKWKIQVQGQKMHKNGVCVQFLARGSLGEF